MDGRALLSLMLVTACDVAPCPVLPAHVCEEGVDRSLSVPMDEGRVAGCAFQTPSTCALGCASVDAGCAKSFLEGPLAFPVTLTTSSWQGDGGTLVTLAGPANASLQLELRERVHGGLVQTGEVRARLSTPAGGDVGVLGSVTLNAAANGSEHWGGTFSITLDGGTSLSGGFDARP